MRRNQCCQRPAVLCAVAFALVCVPAIGAQTSATVAARRDRVTDAIIARDLARFDSLVQRAPSARSAAIIGLAREAYERNDGTDLSSVLMGYATQQAPTPSLRGRRADLWALVDSVAQRGNLTDASRTQLVALETALIRANSPVLGAPSCAAWEQRAASIASTLRVPPPVVASTPVTAPAPVVAPVLPVTPKVLRAVPSRVHFAYDKSLLAPASRGVLDALVDSLTAYPDVKIFLEGHTDPRGSVEYNIGLSKRRVTAVHDYLISKGLSAARFTTAALGKSQLETASSGLRDLARNRRVTLRYVGPDGREIPTIVQLDDLQIEQRKR